MDASDITTKDNTCSCREKALWVLHNAFNYITPDAIQPRTHRGEYRY